MTPPSTTTALTALLAFRMEQVGVASPSLLRLTSGLARGDDVAWGEFHREYGPSLFRQLIAATRGDHDLAGEALQQTYLRVARYVRPCDCERTFLAWLRVVRGSALSDCRRRRKTFWELLAHRREDRSDVETEPESDVADQKIQAALDLALIALDPEDRALLEGKYFAGRDVKTLAATLGVSPKAAESRLTRARAELRRHLTALLSRHE